MHRWNLAAVAALVFLISGNLSAQTDIDSFAVKLSRFSGSYWGKDPNSARFAVFSDKKEQLTPYRFESVQPFRDGVAIAVTDGRYQLVYADGSLSDELFDELFEVQGGWYYGNNGRDWSILDKKGKPAFTLDFVHPSDWDGYLRIRSSGKVGLLDTSGRMVLSPQYDWIRRFKYGYSEVCYDRKRGLIDSLGKLVVPLAYDEIRTYSDENYYWYKKEIPSYVYNFWLLKKDKNITLFHKKFGVVEGSSCDLLGNYSEDYVVFRNGNKFGYMDTLGHVVIPAAYDLAYGFSDGLARVTKDKKMGMIDRNGNVVVPFEYKTIKDFKDGSYEALVTYSQSHHFDINGNIIRKIAEFTDDDDRPPHEYPEKKSDKKSGPDWLEGYRSYKANGYIVASKGNAYGVFDSLGNNIVPVIYEEIYVLLDHQFTYKRDNRWGLINNKGKEVTAPLSDIELNNYKSYNAGLVGIIKNRKVGMINKSGVLKIPAEYDVIYKFSDYGFAYVQNNGLYGVIDTNGNLVVPMKFESIKEFVDDQGVFFPFMYKPTDSHRVQVFVSRDGKVVKEYDYADDFYNGVSIVQTGEWGDNKRFGAIDLDGREIVPMSKKEVSHFSSRLLALSDENLQQYELIDIKTGKRKGKVYHAPVYQRGKLPLYVARISGKAGFIDSSGEVVYPIELDTIVFIDHRTIYRKGTCWGVLDSLLKPELPCNYQYIGHYTDNSLLLKKDGQWQFHELEKTKTPGKKTGAESKMKAVRKNNKWGWEDASGKTIIPYVFDAVKPFQDGKTWVFLESFGRPVRINMKGEIILEYYP